MYPTLALGGSGAEGNSHIGVICRLAQEGFHIKNSQEQVLAGSTRHMDIMPHDHGLEIRGTWYGPEF